MNIGLPARAGARLAEPAEGDNGKEAAMNRHDRASLTPDELAEHLRHRSELERMELSNGLGNNSLPVQPAPDWPEELGTLAANHNGGAEALAAGWAEYDAALQRLPRMMLMPALKGKLVAAAAANLRAARYDLLQTWIDVLRSRQRVLVKVIDFLEARSTAAAAELLKRQEAAGKRLRAAGLGPSDDPQFGLSQDVAQRRFVMKVNQVPQVREVHQHAESIKATVDAARGGVNVVDEDIARVGVVLVQAWRDLTGIVP